MLDLDGKSTSGLDTIFTVTLRTIFGDDNNTFLKFSNISNSIYFIYDYRTVFEFEDNEERLQQNVYYPIVQIDYMSYIPPSNYVVLVPDNEYSVQSIIDMKNQEKSAINFNDIIYIAYIQQIRLNDENSIGGVGLLNNGNIIIILKMVESAD